MLVNFALRAHANESGPVDYSAAIHWGSAPGGELLEAHDLTGTEWADLRTETLDSDQAGFLAVLTSAITPSGFAWSDSTGAKVKVAAWKCAQQVWA